MVRTVVLHRLLLPTTYRMQSTSTTGTTTIFWPAPRRANTRRDVRKRGDGANGAAPRERRDLRSGARYHTTMVRNHDLDAGVHLPSDGRIVARNWIGRTISADDNAPRIDARRCERRLHRKRTPFGQLLVPIRIARIIRKAVHRNRQCRVSSEIHREPRHRLLPARLQLSRAVVEGKVSEREKIGRAPS